MAKVTKEQIDRYLPRRPEMPNASLPTREERVEQGYASAKAKELFAQKREEQQRQARIEKARELGFESLNPEDVTEHRMEELAAEQRRERAVSDLIAESPSVVEVTPQQAGPEGAVPILSRNKLSQTLALQGAAKADVVKLLNSLNINLNVQLTKADTANLLACLLTCNESQLNALLNNKKVPIVIKTVINRLLHDAEKGNMGAIELLWDRVFGKGPMSVSLPEDAAGRGLIPNTPVSREAYIVIRETLMK